MTIIRIALAILALAMSSKIEWDPGLSWLSISLQSLVLMLVPRIVGRDAALWVVLLYLVLGFCGLPVFSSSPGGLALLSSPGLGYLLGFFPAVLIAACAPTGFFRRVLAFFWAHVVILFCGVLGLYINLDVALTTSLVDGALVFVPGGIVKSLLAALILTALGEFTPRS